MDAVGALAANVLWIWLWVLNIGMFGQSLSKITSSRPVELIWRACARVHQEIWIAIPPCVVLKTMQDWRSPSPWSVILYAACLGVWWRSRNWPEDNNWKKRGKKLKDAIAVRAGRLVVVPARA